MVRATLSIALTCSLMCLARSALADDEVDARGSAREQKNAVRPLMKQAAFGAFVPGLPYYPEKLRRLDRLGFRGRNLEIVSGFVDWDYVFGEPRDVLLSRGGARKLLYSWEPHCAQGSCIRFRDVLEGKHDAYFLRIAESMRTFRGDIYVRPWAEMNAPWSAWQPGTDKPRAGSVDEFKQAWRYVVDFFRAQRVDNLHFVFSPDAEQDADSVPIAQLWPGREYVDVLGIDGYNWGNSGPGGSSKWREFHEVFEGMYASLTALDPEAPVWICEFGSKEPRADDGTETSPSPADPDHDKGVWLERALHSTLFPRITALVYYSSVPGHSEYRRDFRIDSSPSSLAAVRKHWRARGR